MGGYADAFQASAEQPEEFDHDPRPPTGRDPSEGSPKYPDTNEKIAAIWGGAGQFDTVDQSFYTDVRGSAIAEKKP